jgi:hypothetical protein
MLHTLSSTPGNRTLNILCLGEHYDDRKISRSRKGQPVNGVGTTFHDLSA